MDMKDLYRRLAPAYDEAGPGERRLIHAEVSRALQDSLGVSGQSVWLWAKNGIPLKWQLELVKRYGLDPGLLLK